jgi:hypothetical protein
MLLPLAFIVAFLFSSCEKNNITEPISTDSTDQYAGIKNQFKISFNGYEWQADSIKISKMNGTSPHSLLNGYILNGVQNKEGQRISAGLMINPTNSSIYIGLGTIDSTWVALLYHKASFSYWKYDTLKNTYSGKFSLDYDDLYFGKGHIECEFINMEDYLYYLPQTYVLDTTKEYSYSRQWYYVGASDGSLKNFTLPPSYTMHTPIFYFLSRTLGSEYSSIYKYKHFCQLVSGGFSIDGSWDVVDNKLYSYFCITSGWYSYYWDADLINTFKSALEANNYSIEKENNILKVYYNEHKSALIFYAKPEEYDQILYKKSTKINNTYKKHYTDKDILHNLMFGSN